MNKRKETSLVVGATPEFIARRIVLVRGHKVILDSDLAELYQVETGHLNRAVKRNRERFPSDFMFQIKADEQKSLICQSGISNNRRGGSRHTPYAFTELGIAMLSSVLNSDRAVQMNIFIMRAFVKLREMLATHKDLARKIRELEKGQDEHTENLIVITRALNELRDTSEKLEAAHDELTPAIGFEA